MGGERRRATVPTAVPAGGCAALRPRRRPPIAPAGTHTPVRPCGPSAPDEHNALLHLLSVGPHLGFDFGYVPAGELRQGVRLALEARAQRLAVALARRT